MEEMGLMRTRIRWLAVLLTAGVALAPGGARAQNNDYEVPILSDPEVPLPTYHIHPETGGFYAAGEFMFWRQTNPLKQQVIGVRGLEDFDGSITADLNGTFVNPSGAPPFIIPGTPMPGTFLGSGTAALSADNAKGPLSYEPGWRLTAGWRFRDGVAVDFSWMQLIQAKYAAVATLIPPTLNPGPLFTETFLFSPVYNFPNDFAGPPQKTALGNPFAAYGIWNGASIMQETFVQRYTEYNINGRVPVLETDYCRAYGLVGFRHVYLWERFQWRTVAEDFTGAQQADWAAIYNNIVSNQMYGPYIGCGSECWLGNAFSCSLDLKAAGMIDFVHEIADYQRQDFVIESKRAKREYTFVPELSAELSLWWYPIQGVEVRIGYDFMAFFNTIASPYPVSFDYGAPTPGWTSQSRFLDGFRVGLSFIF
jgi:hypothetical protein